MNTRLANFPIYVTSSTASSTMSWTRFPTIPTWGVDQGYHENPFGRRSIAFTASDGQNIKIGLPDGSVFCLADDGSYTIADKDAKITYRANRIREFNRFLNASDLMEEFIAFLGTKGARQKDVLGVPIEVFINWLIMRAAMQDNVPVPEGLRIENHPRLMAPKPRCRSCGRFIPRRHMEAGVPFCNEAHMALKARALLAPAG
jgi:hypothetical protein